MYDWVKNVNWKDAIMGLPGAMTKAVSKVADWIRPTMEKTVEEIAAADWEFKWKPLTEGFKSSLTAMPEVARRVMSDLERELEMELGEMSDELRHAWGAVWAKIKAPAIKPPPAVPGEPGMKGFVTGPPEPTPTPKPAVRPGEWMGLADIWRRLQTTGVQTEIQIAKQQLGELKGINKGVNKLVELGPSPATLLG